MFISDLSPFTITLTVLCGEDNMTNFHGYRAILDT